MKATKNEFKPQVGDMYIKSLKNEYFSVYRYENDWTGWRDRLGYSTLDEKYAMSFINGMEVYHEDDKGQEYYRLPVPVPMQQEASIPTISDENAALQEQIPVSATASKGDRDITVGTYTRTITTRSITFQCVQCNQTVTREQYPSPKNLYCGDGCRKEVVREQTRLRVQAMRAKKKQSA